MIYNVIEAPMEARILVISEKNHNRNNTISVNISINKYYF